MKQVTAILLGAGQRGAEAYASYALDYPNELKFVAVAEPRADRREEFAKLHDIAPQNAVESDMELLNRPKMADCVLICTQDQMHYEPVTMALNASDPVCRQVHSLPYILSEVAFHNFHIDFLLEFYEVLLSAFCAQYQVLQLLQFEIHLDVPVHRRRIHVLRGALLQLGWLLFFP